MNEQESLSPPAEDQIDVKDSWQVLWWCRILNITKTQLETAVDAVGCEPKDIRHYLFQRN